VIVISQSVACKGDAVMQASSVWGPKCDACADSATSHITEQAAFAATNAMLAKTMPSPFALFSASM